MHIRRPIARNHSHRIGIIGAGGIVRTAHLPAYKKAGFTVSAIYDKEHYRAESLSREFGIPKVCRSLEDILKDPSVDIIDLAVPPEAQAPIVLQAVREGRHLLCQKPLARNTKQAEVLVKASEAEHVKLAVNVSMRWGPANREISTLIHRGAVGPIKQGLIDVKYCEDWSVWPWLLTSDRLLILFDMIHILDFIRTIMGEPLHVEARYGRARDSDVVGETWANMTLHYANDTVIRYNEDSRFSPEQTIARYHFTGSHGSLAGTFGIYYDIPRGRADTIAVVPSDAPERGIPEQELSGRWVPDAFSESMRALMLAIETNSEPSNSGRDHLKTLSLIDRIYSAGQLEFLPHRPM